VRDVVAVLEVKKRLFSRELADAQEQLRDVLDIYGDYIVRDAPESFNIEPSLFAFGKITGVVPPTHDEASSLPFHLEMLYRTLIVEQTSPLRIILGYGGYASEFSFRQAFVRFLKKGLSRSGFGAGSLPHLVICGKHCLVKTNGHPYSAPLHNDRWLIVASSNENPLIFLLELIWTRLSLANCHFARNSSGFPFCYDSAMRNLVVLFIHFIATLARLLGPGGVRSLVAESLLIKHQLLIANRSRQRSPNLHSSRPHPRRLAGALGASNSSPPFCNRTEALDTARPSQSYEQAKVPDAVLHQSP